MQTGRKFVLVSLCDAANDDGACFLCVETLAYKTGMSVRAVQGHLADLEKQGYIMREDRLGRSSIYSVNVLALENAEKHQFWVKRQRGYITPAESAPPQILHKTPAESAPAPAESAPITVTYPSLNLKSNGNTKTLALLVSMNVCESVASDWMQIRKTKKSAITQTALDGIQREADKAGLSLENALRVCCERGWAGFAADWYTNASAGQRNATSVQDARLDVARQIMGNKNGNDRSVIEINPRTANQGSGACFSEALDGVWKSTDGEMAGDQPARRLSRLG
jgi:DNA-binding transcriptional ArsR family regulator